ncbi:hypothetical protein [Leptospira terpstrae]|uniref:Uncharacterized protein n=1 Tax=Leptospira terpstrae serovar Hualin str. LT 11-33 = ATCC 700639 TaxID=1257025 RepID=N1VSR4_9LEPT|nr:hypothetical protein [Leptospira terpstrae]EMY60065.1 hypothetical protein LEP1GSC203_1087 [Leptospira terpstrae serovar Hualin str. LT 11-33 = ATCC 700639]
MNKEDYSIKSHKELGEFVESLKKNPQNYDKLLDFSHREYLEIKSIFDLLMQIYNEFDITNEMDLALKKLISRFYLSYNTINLIGNFKTKIYNNTLKLDDFSIAAILRIMLEIEIKTTFIFSHNITDPNKTAFKFNIWKYCDLKSNSYKLIGLESSELSIENLNNILLYITSNSEYNNLSKESKNAIERGNWSKFHSGFLYPNSEANQSIVTSFWYMHFSTFIHTSYNSIEAIESEKSSLENMLIYFGLASYIGKKILILLNSIENKALINTNSIYSLHLEEKFTEWNKEFEDIRIFDSDLTVK